MDNAPSDGTALAVPTYKEGMIGKKHD